MKRIKILARKKLKLSPGKLAAQSVHAALALAELDKIDSTMVGNRLTGERNAV